MKKENYEECISFVTSHYKDDFNPSQLQLHLDTLATNFRDDGISSATIFDIKDYILGFLPGKRCLILEVCTVLKLVMVMSSTNGMSERSFSALRRVKSYLRSTTTQTQLNHLNLLHVHKNFMGLS